MKSLLSLLFILSLLIIGQLSAQVHGNMENQNVFVAGKTTTAQIDVSIKEKLPISRFSWTGWILVNKNWAESYVGISYSPINEIEVSVSYGLETNPKPARVGWSLWVGKFFEEGKIGISNISLFEQGGSGYWFKHISKVKLWDVSVGTHYQRSKGFGPYIETTFVKKFTIWSSCLFNNNQKNVFAGIKLLF